MKGLTATLIWFQAYYLGIVSTLRPEFFPSSSSLRIRLRGNIILFVGLCAVVEHKMHVHEYMCMYTYIYIYIYISIRIPPPYYLAILSNHRLAIARAGANRDDD